MLTASGFRSVPPPGTGMKLLKQEDIKVSPLQIPIPGETTRRQSCTKERQQGIQQGSKKSITYIIATLSQYLLQRENSYTVCFLLPDEDPLFSLCVNQIPRQRSKEGIQMCIAEGFHLSSFCLVSFFLYILIISMLSFHIHLSLAISSLEQQHQIAYKVLLLFLDIKTKNSITKTQPKRG